jgi:hypothetical protein
VLKIIIVHVTTSTVACSFSVSVCGGVGLGCIVDFSSFFNIHQTSAHFDKIIVYFLDVENFFSVSHKNHLEETHKP